MKLRTEEFYGKKIELLQFWLKSEEKNNGHNTNSHKQFRAKLQCKSLNSYRR